MITGKYTKSIQKPSPCGSSQRPETLCFAVVFTQNHTLTVPKKTSQKGPEKLPKRSQKWGPEKTLCNNQMGGRLAREASPGLIIIA